MANPDDQETGEQASETSETALQEKAGTRFKKKNREMEIGKKQWRVIPSHFTEALHWEKGIFAVDSESPQLASHPFQKPHT